MRIESGPTGERKVRTLLMLLMVGVFSVWFAYDGVWGYPAENREVHLQQLPTPEERELAKDATIYEGVAPDKISQVRKAIRREPDPDRQRRGVEQILGGPPSYKTEDTWYYFGPTSGIKVLLEDGRPKKTDMVQGYKVEHTANDMLLQKVLAAGLAIIALYLIWLFIRVLRTHLVLDDGGLSYQGKGPIRFEDMKALLIDRFFKKGWVELAYDDHGTERKLRLDEYHLACFNEVIDAICARRGFENPIPLDQKRREEKARGTQKA